MHVQRGLSQLPSERKMLAVYQVSVMLVATSTFGLCLPELYDEPAALPQIPRYAVFDPYTAAVF